MAYNLHVVKTSDFVRLDAHGQVDLEESSRLLSGVAKACLERGIDCALLDVRDLETDLGLTDMYALAKTFQEIGFKLEQRVAILHRYRAGERAEFFAMCASDRGWNVRAFDNYEEALEWFSAAQPLD